MIFGTLALGVPVGSVATGAYLLGVVVSAWSVFGLRRRVRAREIEIQIPGLADSFDGYRIVQLSDLHIGSFDPKQRGLDWVRQANALSPDLAVVTGDLVTAERPSTTTWPVSAELHARMALVTLGN
jgi:predicted MPP superfamily phosphohydrolase